MRSIFYSCMNARQACGKHFADGGKVKKTVS